MNDTLGGLPGDGTMIAEANKTFLPQLLWTTTRRRPQGVAATMWKQSSCQTVNSEHPDQFRAKCGVFRAISHQSSLDPAGTLLAEVKNRAPHSLKKNEQHGPTTQHRQPRAPSSLPPAQLPPSQYSAKTHPTCAHTLLQSARLSQ